MLKIGTLVVLLFMLQPVEARGSAGPEAGSCTVGDAQAMFEAGSTPLYVTEPHGIARPKLLDLFFRCQYQIWRDGETFTFSEKDIFLGQITWFSDYQQLEITRQEGISEIELRQNRVWLAKVLPGGAIGEWVEQPLMQTAYKNMLTSTFGLVVYQRRAFITQLPPGEYLSYSEFKLPDLDFSATVRLVVTPAGIAQ